jgi:hypothetical protein
MAEADRQSTRAGGGGQAEHRRSAVELRKGEHFNPKRPKIAPNYGFLVEQGMEELDQLELTVDKLMQGMKDLN